MATGRMGSWEEVGSDEVAAKSEQLYRRCDKVGCERFCRDGTPCYCGGVYHKPTGEPAPFKHEVACRRVGEGDYVPPEMSELMQYEGPND